MNHAGPLLRGLPPVPLRIDAVAKATFATHSFIYDSAPVKSGRSSLDSLLRVPHLIHLTHGHRLALLSRQRFAIPPQLLVPPLSRFKLRTRCLRRNSGAYAPEGYSSRQPKSREFISTMRVIQEPRWLTDNIPRQHSI
jgi:hypothetical protein